MVGKVRLKWHFFLQLVLSKAGTLDNNSEKQWILEHQQKISYLNVTIKADRTTPMTLRVFIANNITT